MAGEKTGISFVDEALSILNGDFLEDAQELVETVIEEKPNGESKGRRIGNTLRPAKEGQAPRQLARPATGSNAGGVPKSEKGKGGESEPDLDDELDGDEPEKK